MAFNTVIRKYHFSISASGLRQVWDLLLKTAPVVMVGKEKNLIAVNNGIFDYETKKLLDFSPEHVFVSKCRVDLVDNPFNISIHNNEDGTDWNIEDWIQELTDDPQIEKLLWQIIGASIRHGVRWDKAIFLYSARENSGKETFCTLLRNFCGEGNQVSIAINDMAPFKVLVTGDKIQIEEKNKAVVDFRFSGLMVQCINSLPRVNDKTTSFYQRFLLVPFEKCFTGMERKYIKDDYLNRKEVLEYVLHKILVDMPSYYEFDIPDVCEKMLGENKTFNDPVRQFAEEILPQLKWDLVPFKFLYDLFKAWYKENVPSGKVQGKTIFTRELGDVLEEWDEWKVKKTSVPTKGYEFGMEPLIGRYNLTYWMNSRDSGNDLRQKYIPPAAVIKSSAAGILRVKG